VAVLADKNGRGPVEDPLELQSLDGGLRRPSATCGERKLTNTRLYSFLKDQTQQYHELIHLSDVSDQGFATSSLSVRPCVRYKRPSV